MLDDRTLVAGGFDGPELDASGKTFHGTSGDDTRTGTNGGDTFNYGQGGDDTLSGLGGSDTFNMGIAFNANDTIDGGNGDDTLALSGDYVDLALAPDTITSIETISLHAGHSYMLNLADGNIAKNHTITIDGSALGAHDALEFGSNDVDGSVNVMAGAGDDFVFGGPKADHLYGGDGDDLLGGQGGNDILEGGPGHDVYIAHVSSSAGDHSTVVGFDTHQDRFDVARKVTHISHSLDGGALNKASFNHDLTAAMKGELHKDHAIVFVPDSGDLAGHIFLVVDQDGKAGYHVGQDLVVELDSPVHLGALSLSDFNVAD